MVRRDAERRIRPWKLLVQTTIRVIAGSMACQNKARRESLRELVNCKPRARQAGTSMTAPVQATLAKNTIPERSDRQITKAYPVAQRAAPVCISANAAAPGTVRRRQAKIAIQPARTAPAKYIQTMGAYCQCM